MSRPQPLWTITVTLPECIIFACNISVFCTCTLPHVKCLICILHHLKYFLSRNKKTTTNSSHAARFKMCLQTFCLLLKCISASIVSHSLEALQTSTAKRLGHKPRTRSWKIGQGLSATLSDRARWTKLNMHAYIGTAMHWRSMMQGCSAIWVH